MAKAFTYTRLPEHQVAVYFDGSDKTERPSEWNIVECLFSFVSCLLLLVTFPISVFFCIKEGKKEETVLQRSCRLYGDPTLQPFGCKNRFKCACPSAKGSQVLYRQLKVIKDYERAVIFRLGRLLPPKGPGVIFINPCIDTWTRVDTRARAFSVPPQQIRTSDGGYVSVGAEVQFGIKDAVLSKTAVQDLNHSLRMLAQTTLVHCLASRKLAEVQHDRKFINKQVQEVVNRAAAVWGVEIKRIEMSEVSVLKEADEVVGALSALFGGGSPSAKLGNMTFAADPGLASMLSAMGAGNVRSAPPVPDSSGDSAHSGSEETGVNLLTPEQLVKLVSGVLNESLVKEIGGMFQFNILGENGGTWYLDLRSGHGRIYTDKPLDKPNVVLTMSVEDMQKIFYGQTTAFDAYMQGTLKVDGDLKMAMNLEQIVKMLKEKPVIPDKQVLQRPGVYIV